MPPLPASATSPPPSSSPPDGGKLAMSKALGAAFLTHQVQELERAATATVGRRGGAPGRARAAQGDAEVVIPASCRCVVLDASMLVHALSQVKRWAAAPVPVDLVVPLEALNTLDDLKKGTSPTAQKARAATRALERLVGSDTRLRVQREDAFVPWDDIAPPNAAPPPEWLRRTLCCAAFEPAALLAVVDADETRDWAARVGVGIMHVGRNTSAPPSPLPAPSQATSASATVMPARPRPPAKHHKLFDPASADAEKPRTQRLFDPHADGDKGQAPPSPRILARPRVSPPAPMRIQPRERVSPPNKGREAPVPRAVERAPAAPVVRLLSRGQTLEDLGLAKPATTTETET